jgi:hypothetical protein
MIDGVGMFEEGDAGFTAATVVFGAMTPAVLVTAMPTRMPVTEGTGSTSASAALVGIFPLMSVAGLFVLMLKVGAVAELPVTTVPSVWGANDTTVPAGT